MESQGNGIPKYYVPERGKMFGSKYSPLNKALVDIDERLNELEHKANKTAKKNETTRAQQMLLLHYLGALKSILDLDITKQKKSKLLSVLLNSSSENLEKDLSALNQKDSILHTSNNYEMLVKTFQGLGMKKLEKSCQIELDRILKREENEKNKK